MRRGAASECSLLLRSPRAFTRLQILKRKLCRLHSRGGVGLTRALHDHVTKYIACGVSLPGGGERIAIVQVVRNDRAVDQVEQAIGRLLTYGRQLLWILVAQPLFPLALC